MCNIQMRTKMAHREETEQQFMESIVRQASGKKIHELFTRTTSHRLNQNPVMNDYDSNQNELDEEENNVQTAIGAETNPIRNVPDPVMKNMRFRGGYSTDVGRMPQNRKNAPTSSVGLEPRIEMRRVKQEIGQSEKQLHNLQKKKVKLMRKITGRLESTNNKFEDNVDFFKEFLT